MRKQTLALIAVLAAVAVYVALFFAARLPSLEMFPGGTFRRWYFFWYLVTPDALIEAWFGEAGQAAILDRLPILALASGIVAVAACLGWLMLILIGAERRLTRLEIFVFSTAVGLATISTYVLAVGLLGAVRNRLIFVVPGVLIAAAAGWLFARRRTAQAATAGLSSSATQTVPRKHCWASQQWHPSGNTAGQASSGTRVPTDWLSPRWLWLAAPFAVMILLAGMLPPLDFDVREYHLQVPKEFFEQGRIGFLAHNVYGNMAMGTEMLSLLGMSLSGDWWLGALVGKTVIGVFAPLAALGLLAAGRRFFSPTAGIVAAVVYLATPWVARVSTTGLVEGAAACYLLLAVYAMLLWRGHGFRVRSQNQAHRLQPVGREEKSKCKMQNAKCKTTDDRASSPLASRPSPLASRPSPLASHLSPLLLSGYLAGGAVATKYPAALFVFLPLVVWLAVIDGWKCWRRAVTHLTLFTLAAAVVCGLWFGKNWVLTGNPTYPLLNDVFHSSAWSAEQDARWNAHHRPHDFSFGTLAADAGRVAMTSEWLSPILMPLAALGLLSVFWLRASGDNDAAQTRRERRLATALAVYVAFVLAAWWLLTHRIDRFWIPVLPLLALLAGRGACWRADRPWHAAVAVMLVLTAIFGYLVDASVASRYSRFFVSLAQLRSDPARVSMGHLWLNAHAVDGRVLLVGDAQPFDLNMPVEYNTTFDRSVFEQIAFGRTPEEARRELVRRGITHVLVDWNEVARYRSAGNYGITDFIQPALFGTLVAEGVLRIVERFPRTSEHPSVWIYAVVREDR